MSNDEQGTIHSGSEGGVAGTLPSVGPVQFAVGPSTSNEFNTVQLRLIPIACWKVEDIRFAFDSSFVTPDIAAEIQQLQALREKHKKPDVSGNTQYPPLSIFGHADPVGPAVDPDGYNKALSGRRASAIYAVLIVNSNSSTAVNLWRQISDTERWGAEQKQVMQANVPAGTSDSDLFKAYMQSLCPADLNLTPQDFLAKGVDSKGKGDYQGCSSFNPLLIFSQQAEDEYEQAERNQDKPGLEMRNAANAQNRRVMALLFRPGSQVIPTKWPCPRATDDKTGCIKRFWSDGEKRRQIRLPDTERKYQDTQDTLACRFYDRLVRSSPCEGALTYLWILDEFRKPMPVGTPYSVMAGGATLGEGFLTQPGIAVIPNVPAGATIQGQWADFKEPNLVAPEVPNRTTGANAPHARMLLAASVDAAAADTLSAPPAKDRSSIYVPVTPGQMKSEAESIIDPATVDPISPSWQEDGLDFFDETSDGHFLARKLVRLEATLHPEGVPSDFDSRLYYTHPLDVRYFPVVNIPPEAAKQTYFYSSTATVVAAATESPDTPTQTKEMLKNLQFTSLEDFKQERRLDDDNSEAKLALRQFHENPGESQTG